MCLELALKSALNPFAAPRSTTRDGKTSVDGHSLNRLNRCAVDSKPKKPRDDPFLSFLCPPPLFALRISFSPVLNKTHRFSVQTRVPAPRRLRDALSPKLGSRRPAVSQLPSVTPGALFPPTSPPLPRLSGATPPPWSALTPRELAQVRYADSRNSGRIHRALS